MSKNKKLAEEWLESFQFSEEDGEFYTTPEDREFLCAAIRVWLSVAGGELPYPHVEIDQIVYVPKVD